MSERITKLYFDPVTYPPPKNELECDNIVFGHLKEYIVTSAKRVDLLSFAMAMGIIQMKRDLDATACIVEGIRIRKSVCTIRKVALLPFR